VRRRSKSIALRRPAAEEPRGSFAESAPGADAGARVELHFHFDRDLSAQQIEKIFQSMGQYLSKR
jgi:hypothetical protein